MSIEPEKPRRRPRWLTIACGLALVVTLVGGVVVVSLRTGSAPKAGGRAGPAPASAAASAAAASASVAAPVDTPTGPPCLSLGTGQDPPVVDFYAGLLLYQLPGGEKLGSGLDRCDRTALDGPWTVVVRRWPNGRRSPDGTFGRRGAVVTFPVDPPAAGRRVPVGRVTGVAAPGTVTWPIAGRYARIRGDQSEADLLAVAAHTTVEAGHPVVIPTPGWVIWATGPYRPPSIHERRFSSKEVREVEALGDGLVFTGITTGGGYEDLLYTLPARDGYQVRERPSVVSSVFGGNAAVAWEVAPGLIAYVGYSGSETTDAAVEALHRLAWAAEPMDAHQWLKAGAQVVDQTNEPG